MALAAAVLTACTKPAPSTNPIQQVESLLTAATAHEQDDRGDFDERLAAALATLGASDGAEEPKVQELGFRVAEARARHTLRPEARVDAIDRADRLLARGLAQHCAVAQQAALLAGEGQGKQAMTARLQDLQRDAELAHVGECQASTAALLAGLGVRAKKIDLGGAAPRVDSIVPLFDETSARVVVALQAAADASVLSAIRLRDDRLSAGTVTSVHLPGIALTEGVPREIAGTGLVTRITTTSAVDGTDVRFELSGSGSKRVHFLLEPPRIVVDLAPAGRAQHTGKVHRIVLDPGHGGFDPGAIGPGGVREKDVALDVALRAARALRTAGFDVRLTRDADRAVPLENRSAMANAADADLFVSVHCNASESAQGHGIETYVLDDAKGAEVALRVAARENGGSQGGVIALSALLARTQGKEHAGRSRAFAEKLQRSAVTSIRAEHAEVKDGGVHPAAFSVLVGARMPAVLFETSYVSNAREGAWLATPEYRQTLADAMVRAIEDFGQP
jgi:N-acetylmuramoyl-L-alanine amidase